MAFDKWFEKQSLLIKIILLVIPGLGWVIELLVRLSAFLRKNSTINLAGLILGILAFFVWEIADIIVLLLTGEMLLLE